MGGAWVCVRGVVWCVCWRKMCILESAGQGYFAMPWPRGEGGVRGRGGLTGGRVHGCLRVCNVVGVLV